MIQELNKRSQVCFVFSIGTRKSNQFSSLFTFLLLDGILFSGFPSKGENKLCSNSPADYNIGR